MIQCKSCKKRFPATTVFFYKEYRVKTGLKSKCKPCVIKQVIKNRFKRRVHYALYRKNYDKLYG